jgi:hypothetical protein
MKTNVFAKMKKILFFIAFLFYINNTDAQNVKQYYKHISRAEKKLIENEFVGSVKEYKRALSSKMYFDSDLMNAFKTSLLAKSNGDIILFWNRMKTNPVLVSRLKNDETLLTYPSNIVREEIRQLKEPEYVKSKLESITDSVLNVDQSARHRCGYNFKKECIDLFRSTDSINIYYLDSLLSKGRYSRSELSGNGGSAIYSIYIVALHARRFGHTNLDSILINYIKKGDIKPYWYAVLNADISDLSYAIKEKLSAIPKLGLGYFYIGINDKIVEFKANDSLIAIFNKNRKGLYMDDVETEMAKLKFVQSTPLFKNSPKSLGIDLRNFVMSAKEAKEMIEDFKQKNLLKE